MPSPEGPEEVARRELVAIHPNIRAEVTETMDMDVWKKMSFVEKLEAVKQKLPMVSVSLTEFEKESARFCAETIFDGPAQPLEDDLGEEGEEGEEGAVEEGAKPHYWAPPGRCPYGMDTGYWAITKEEMRQHNSAHSCWISIGSQVYDVTKWLKKHPGGAAAILAFAGGDATDAFQAQGHSPHALSHLEQLHVGRLSDPEADAIEELLAIHPDDRAEAMKDIANSEWIAMTMVQKLEFVKQRLPRLQPSLIGGVEGKLAGDAGGAVPGQTSSEPKPAVCPVSGKAGVCPVQAMHGHSAASPPVGGEDEGGTGQKAPKAEDACTIA